MSDAVGAELAAPRFWQCRVRSAQRISGRPALLDALRHDGGVSARTRSAYYMTAFRTFGDVVGFHVGPFRSLLIAHPDHIKHVLQDNNHNYVKGLVIAKLKVLIGEGLFTSEGDFWRRQRRLAQPAFHRQRLAGFVATMTDATRAMLDRWEAVARAAATPSTSPPR